MGKNQSRNAAQLTVICVDWGSTRLVRFPEVAEQELRPDSSPPFLEGGGGHKRGPGRQAGILEPEEGTGMRAMGRGGGHLRRALCIVRLARLPDLLCGCRCKREWWVRRIDPRFHGWQGNGGGSVEVRTS